jgi:iron complex outermembrane receptor protein
MKHGQFMRSGRKAVTLSLLLASATFASAAYAQTATDSASSGVQIEDIVVTAQKRSESAQKVPLSVTAFSSETLQTRGITDVVGLTTSVPGFQAQVYNGVVIPFLRGVGSLGSAISNEPSVGTYVDGIYFPRVPGSFFELRNVERVEVLKGPQGTLFGRNSTGGIINIVTKDPSYDTKVMGSIGYGRFDAFQGDLYATAGLSDKVAVDFTIAGKTDDGYGRNLTLNKRYMFQDSLLLRSKLLFEPAEGTKFVLSGFYAASKSSGSKAAYPGTTTGTFSLPNELMSSTPIPGVPTRVIGYYNSAEEYEAKGIFHMWGVSLRADHDLSFARLTSISGYSREKERNYSDSDYGPRPDQTVPFFGQVKLFTQELQIASLPDNPVNWIAGLYYYNNSTSYPFVQINNTSFPGGALQAPGATKSISYAAFGQATYEILPKLKLTGGLRYTRDKVSGSGQLAFLTTPVTIIPLPDATAKNNKVTFRAALDYQVTDQALVYASFSRGYKAGKFNILTYSPIPTDPETMDAYEVGFKSDLLDRRLRLNGSLFYYDITNPQVQTQTNTTILYSNADSARVKGAEIDAQALITDSLTFRASATYLDSKYKKYGSIDPITGACIDCAPASVADLVNGGAVSVPGGIVANGNRTPLAAKFTYSIGGDYRVAVGDGELLFALDWFHTSGFYNEPDNNNLFQKAYGVLNGQVRYKATENLAVRVWGKNLLDKKYAISAGTNVGPAGYPWNPAPPRTYGIAVDFNF